jgi:hypothetical protein
MRLFLVIYVGAASVIVVVLAYLCYACNEWTQAACPLDLTAQELRYALRHPFSPPQLPLQDRKPVGKTPERADKGDGF